MGFFVLTLIDGYCLKGWQVLVGGCSFVFCNVNVLVDTLATAESPADNNKRYYFKNSLKKYSLTPAYEKLTHA